MLIKSSIQDGSLDDKIKEYKNKNELIKDEKIQFWITQLLKGIDFLHSKQIWHRDIKPSNIFLHKMQLVLGDLGLARNQQNNLNSISAINGTPVYLPPEIVKASKNYTEKIDI